MKTLNVLVVILIFLSLIIVVGVGHGIAPIVFFEVSLFFSLFDGSASAMGDNHFIAFTFSGFIGHILWVTSLITNNIKAKVAQISIGSVLFLSCVLYFATGFRDNAAPKLTLVLAVPAMLTIIIMVYHVFSQKLNQKTYERI